MDDKQTDRLKSFAYKNFNHLGNLLNSHGSILTWKGLRDGLLDESVLLNGKATDAEELVTLDDVVTVKGIEYRPIQGGQGRLQLVGLRKPLPESKEMPMRVHCGYHKCLTLYQRKVNGSALRASRRLALDFSPKGRRPFGHFYHRLDTFYAGHQNYFASSLSGQNLDLDFYNDIRVVRFIRDPRDLLISGYYYHQKKAESWCELAGPNDVDWHLVNGCVPEMLPKDTSLGNYLRESSLEDGLLAEIDMRRYHYESMMRWPKDDPRVKLFRYEDIVGNEVETFDEIFSFLKFPTSARLAARYYAERHRAGKKKANKTHIRNAKRGQWKEKFTPVVEKKFNERYGDLLERYQYL